MLVAVTSCRSDGYYNQKAPGSTFKLPRKAPTNLKLFHELAVGVKDAYAAVGATPRKPTEEERQQASGGEEEYQGKLVLWDFIGNLDFVRVLRLLLCAVLSFNVWQLTRFFGFVSLLLSILVLPVVANACTCASRCYLLFLLFLSFCLSVAGLGGRSVS